MLLNLLSLLMGKQIGSIYNRIRNSVINNQFSIINIQIAGSRASYSTINLLVDGQISPHYSPILYTKHINALVYSLLKMGFANFIKHKFGCHGIIFMHLLRCKTLEIPKYSFGFRRLASA